MDNTPDTVTYEQACAQVKQTHPHLAEQREALRKAKQANTTKLHLSASLAIAIAVILWLILLLGWTIICAISLETGIHVSGLWFVSSLLILVLLLISMYFTFKQYSDVDMQQFYEDYRLYKQEQEALAEAGYQDQ